ncbi:MAG: TatD family hydrolase [Neisseria sp.]|nr:TatD family hydrolase [Neisseria sp.]
MLTDTHCHLADPAFSGNLPEVLAAARRAGVRRFIVPATQRDDFDAVLALASADIRPALGIHPWFAAAAAEADLAQLQTLLQHHPQAWVGEIGLDFYARNPNAAERVQQAEMLLAQLRLAEQLRRPVILHNLKATAALVAAIRRSGFTQGGIAHAFSGSLEEAHALIRCGLFIGIGSLLLNPAAKKARRAAAELPLAHIVLETDSPFMLKNQTNTPANVRKIAETVAGLRGISLAEVAAQTEKNINSLSA